MKQTILSLTLALFALTGVSQAQLKFNYESTGNQYADAAIEKATDQWASLLQDDITINLRFNFSLLGADILAGTETLKQFNSYSSFRNSIGNDITSGDDQTVFNSLPTGTTFSAYMNRTSEAGGKYHEVAYVDDDGGQNNSTVRLATANAKALGLRNPHDAMIDAIISYNREYTWDFDPSNGITGSAHDFLGITLHEIGHALGFISGVDSIGDGAIKSSDGSTGYPDDNQMVFVNSLDFMRHSGESVAAGADIDFTADTRSKYFALGADAGGGGSDWSTGEFYGDGEQASHWKKDSGLGIMDPRAAEGQRYDITDFDLVAFDSIGYDRFSFTAIPEPTGLAVGLLFLIPALSRRRV